MTRFIMYIMQKKLNKLRKSQEAPYIYIKGVGKDYPKYLMYTDDSFIAGEMHKIF